MTKNSANTTINIAEIIAPIISSRDLVSNLKKNISKLKKERVNLDFSAVNFVSRSAAHELLSLKEELNRKLLGQKEVSFINANEDVKKMLRIVAANKAIPEKSRPKFEAKVINIDALLNPAK